MWPSFWTFIFHEFVCSWESGNRRAFPPQMSLRLCPFFGSPCRVQLDDSFWMPAIIYALACELIILLQTHSSFLLPPRQTQKKEKTPAVLHKISAHPRIFFCSSILLFHDDLVSFFFSFLELFECRHEKKKKKKLGKWHQHIFVGQPTPVCRRGSFSLRVYIL